MRIRLQLLANQNWRSNGCYQSLACAPGSGYENGEKQMDYARALRSSTERITGSGYEIERFAHSRIPVGLTLEH